MATFSTATRFRIDGTTENRGLVDLTKRYEKKDNADFLADVAKRIHKMGRSKSMSGMDIPTDVRMCIGLIGEYGLVGYTIRQAQRVIRIDRAASYWSHAFLLHESLSSVSTKNRTPGGAAWILESTLDPTASFSAFVERFGISARPISDYARSRFDPFEPHSVPNMAVIVVSMTDEERNKIAVRADNPYIDQLNYDFASLLGTWYAYITSRGEVVNPLAHGHAVPSSAYVQFAYDAVGIDLAPGSRQRNIAPEHIWQAAKRLSPTFRTIVETKTIERSVIGWYCVRDRACVSAPSEKNIPEIPLTVSSYINAVKRRGR